MGKLYLIDGMSVVFRAYHAMRRSGLQSPDGEPTSAVFAFVNIMTSLLEKEDPERIAVVFDTRAPTFRHEMYPEYKANRDEFPEELVPQLERVKEFLDLLNIERLQKDGYEADDLIGAISKKASETGEEVICVTNDKDYYQLLNKNCKIYKPGGKGGEFDVVDESGSEDKFGVAPDRVIDILALVGDSSDNVPGVKGVGIKTAIPLIKEFGSLEGVYENLNKIESASIRKKLESAREEAFLSKKLVTIAVDVAVDFDIEKTRKAQPDFAALDEFFKKLGFTTIRKKYREKAFEFQPSVAEKLPPVEFEKKTIDKIDKDYKLIDDAAKLDETIEYLKDKSLVAFDLETSSLDRLNCEIVGISLAAEEGVAFYIPVNESELYSKDSESLFSGEKTDFKCLPLETALERLRGVLTDSKIGKCGQNSKFDAFLLLRRGIDVRPIVFDSMVASYLIDSDAKKNLDAIAERELNYKPISIKKLIGEKKSEQKSMRDISPEKIKDYACEDADVALKLIKPLQKKLEQKAVAKLAEDMEFPLISVLTRMEVNGVALDVAALDDISQRISGRISILSEKIYDEAGVDFNLDSPKQLGHVLFEKMNLPAVRKTKTGYSSDAGVLSKLADTYPIAELMLQYRRLVKLKSTYVDALPKLADKKTGRLHTTFNQTATSTGRLSSTDPNLQNIPVRTDLGKEIRRAFIAGVGNKILSADYSQIELRIMAHICEDNHMIEAFKDGADVHAATAAALHGVPLGDVDQDMRRTAKTVNFGVMYGLGEFGLSQRLGIGRKEAKEIIDNYFEKYPGIRRYIDLTIKKARKTGYAETLCGRKRYFPDINSRNRNNRLAAERAAINMPIQGSASDMMKIAMIRIDRRMREEGFKSLMTLQVHDELVFDAVPDEIDSLKSTVEEQMRGALSLGEVPVVVDAGVGANWFEAH